jgi:hypothetical protein
MAIETHDDGTVARIAVLQTNRAGDIRDTWFVPIDESVAVVTTASDQRREGVDLEPPVVGVKHAAAKTRASDASGEDDGA